MARGRGASSLGRETQRALPGGHLIPARLIRRSIPLLALTTALPASAVEIYALYGRDCAVTAGAIVDVGDDEATVLTLDGTPRTVGIEGIQLVARYSILENPFPTIKAGTGAKALLEVRSQSSEGSFRAYATDFFEELVLFLDDQGKIRVVEMDEIVAIERPRAAPGAAPALTHRPVTLVPPPGRERCPPIGAGKAGAPRAATTVMADKLRIDSFWSRLRGGHRAIESLRERTQFYARPILFDQKTRLGILANRTSRAETLGLTSMGLDDLPLYLEFGGGDAYRFQNATSIGAKTWRMIPQIRPIAALRSEFKSHLLHGIFIGNLSGLTAGKALYINAWDPREARPSVWLDSSFNHLTLIGADYGPWSVSYGYYFPTFALGRGQEFREFTAKSASQVARFGFLRPRWQLETFLFYTATSETNDNLADADDHDRRDEASLAVRYFTERFVPLSAEVRSTTVRTHLSVALPGDLTVYGDVVLGRTAYEERAFLRDRPISEWSRNSAERAEFDRGRERTNKLSQTSTGARAGARMDLGKWVALGAEVLYEHMETRGQFDTTGATPEEQRTDQVQSYVAMMELLL